MQASAASGQVPELGAVIYHQGLPSRGVKPCASCHGSSAEGEDEFPRLAGQHVDYLNSRARIAMTKIVSPLSDGEIKAVSVYLESIGSGGAKPASLVATGEKVITVASAADIDTPKVFDAEGKPGNCHYSVWTYGWYCGSFWEALAYHLKNQ
jgi:cytochrome c553